MQEKTTPDAWRDLFVGAAEETLRRFETRIKAVESEWEDSYDKFTRISKRLAGDQGGRPKKKDQFPNEIPVDEAPTIVDKRTPGKADLNQLTREAVARGLMR